MRRPSIIAMTACMTLLLACASTTAQQNTQGSDQSGDTIAKPRNPAYKGAPASAEKLARRLDARHAEDLPEADDLTEVDRAEEALIWIADHDDKMIVRVRALGLLRHYPSDRTLGALLTRATSDKLHPTLLAGTMRGLEGHNDKEPVVALLTKALRHKDRRVAVAAARALAANPDHRNILKAAAEDAQVNEALRKKLTEGQL